MVIFIKKVIFILTIIVILIFLTNNNEIKLNEEDSIRFRIIPNSNSIKDLFIKEKLIENLKEYINIIGNTSDIEKTREEIIINLDNIKNNINDTFIAYNYDQEFKINYGLNYFPEKIYNDTTYEEGYYESVVVEIGEAKGDNFWCIMFPPLCFLEAEENDEIKYEFFIIKIINKLFGL